jgi:O-antigen/teichoic acid export membrane protein
VTARGLTANSALALAADIASKAGALVVVLLGARLLSVGEFSTLVTALAAAGLLTAALDFGCAMLIARDGARSATARGALLRALAAARLPFAVASLAVAAVAGALTGRLFVFVATVALALAGAAALSLAAVFRAAQNFAPEAVQRLVAALLSVAAVAVCGFAVPRADVLVAALAGVALVSLLPLAARAPRVVASGSRELRRGALRRALPLGVLALAIIAYYRSGTLALAALGDDRATAAFGVAATAAFGLLAVPNAITAALLPRLAEQPLHDVPRLTRTALAATLAVVVPIAAIGAAAGPPLLRVGLGSGYAAAGLPFALLCAGLPLIAASGVIGTAFIAVGRLRVVALQVGTSLVVNVWALALLAPTLGAAGASLATVACEAAGLVLLVLAARRSLPGATALRRPPVKSRGELAEIPYGI